MNRLHIGQVSTIRHADILYGNAGDDLLYADAIIAKADAIAQGANQSGSGQQGEWFDAENGNDQAYGSAGNDLIAGGDGDDLLIGGGGDDTIWGDLNTFTPAGTPWRDWSVEEKVEDKGEGNKLYTYKLNNMFVESTAGQGDDVIYAGAGDDAAFGGKGADTLILEAGNDKAWGEAGDDQLLGGDGNDILSGDLTEYACGRSAVKRGQG